jgi:hypothetical protein
LFAVVKKVAPKVASLKFVVYTGEIKDTDLEAFKKSVPGLRVYSLQELRLMGVEFPCLPNPPAPSDLACIMYLLLILGFL